MKDTLIIEHLRRGDEEAFKYIYERHYVLLCRFANQILNDAALSEEVVDDAIFYLWEHRREIEITYSVRAYLMRAVRNRCLNELQSLSHLYGLPASPGLEALNWVIFTSPHSFQASLKS